MGDDADTLEDGEVLVPATSSAQAVQDERTAYALANAMSAASTNAPSMLNLRSMHPNLLVMHVIPADEGQDYVTLYGERDWLSTSVKQVQLDECGEAVLRIQATPVRRPGEDNCIWMPVMQVASVNGAVSWWWLPIGSPCDPPADSALLCKNAFAPLL